MAASTGRRVLPLAGSTRVQAHHAGRDSRVAMSESTMTMASGRPRELALSGSQRVHNRVRSVRDLAPAETAQKFTEIHGNSVRSVSLAG